MSLDLKLKCLEGWTKREATDCWSRYGELYQNKHYGELFTAIIRGEQEQYVAKECETFSRFARQWLYYKNRPLYERLHSGSIEAMR